MRSGCSFAVVAALALIAGSTQAQPDGPQLGPIAKAEKSISREGEGSRRAALNARERQAFDQAVWSKLSDWQNGKALTGTDTSGKVVLIVTWTDYLPTGRKASQAAVRIAEAHKDNVVVVMAHSSQDWANAGKPKSSAGNLLVAHDAKGEFRSAINADLDPDFYVLDRAGSLRFADITAESVDAAVDMLVKESKEDAANINSRMADEAAGILKVFKKSEAINSKGTFVEIPELPFPAPKEDDYNAVKWPPRPQDDSKIQNDPKAELPSKQIPLPSTGWYPSKPELKGRAVLVYEWTPHGSFTYEQFMPEMDDLQRKYGRDLVIVGVMCNFESVGSAKLTPDQRDPKKLMDRFDEICRTRKFEHYLVPSLDSEPYKIINQDSAASPWPAMMVLSSDGWCRWWQHEKAKINGFAALDEIIKKDPGIIARRRVEEEWLKAHKDGN